MTKAEQERLNDLLAYFQQQQEQEGSAEIIAELKACLHQGRPSVELIDAIDKRIEFNKAQLQQSRQHMCELQKELAQEKARLAGLTLAASYKDLLPIILPALGKQTAGLKS